MKTTVYFKKGIDDLLQTHAFIGNSQGDETKTNNISEYLNSGGWLSYVFKDIDITDQEAIYRESAKRAYENKKYIKKLKDENSYEELYPITLEFQYNEKLDSNKIQPAPSYTFWVEDITKQ